MEGFYFVSQYFPHLILEEITSQNYKTDKVDIGKGSLRKRSLGELEEVGGEGNQKIKVEMGEW